MIAPHPSILKFVNNSRELLSDKGFSYPEWVGEVLRGRYVNGNIDKSSVKLNPEKWLNFKMPDDFVSCESKKETFLNWNIDNTKVTKAPLSNNLSKIETLHTNHFFFSLEKFDHPSDLLFTCATKEPRLINIPKNQTAILKAFESGTENDRFIASHDLFFIEDNSKALIEIDIKSESDVERLYNLWSQINIGRNCECSIFIKSSQDSRSTQLIKIDAFVGANSTLNIYDLSTEGLSIRRDINCRLLGEKAKVNLNSLSFMDAHSSYHQFFHVKHNATNTSTSHEHFSLLKDKASSEYDSLVHIENNAKLSTSHQLNKNYLLNDGGRAFSRPRLKIDTDDVACEHGSTFGQLDSSEILYLRSRGLSENIAKALVVEGIGKKLIENFLISDWQKRASECFMKKLEQTIDSRNT